MKFVGIRLIVIMTFVSYWTTPVSAQEENFLKEFIRNNSDKAAFHIKIGSDEYGHNSDQAMPLASLSKTIIGIEFAEQTAIHKVDPEKMIDLKELDRFVIGDDNYKTWLKKMQAKKMIDNNKIPLKYIAQGMIQESANACADYIINVIGIDAINQRLDVLGINHDRIFPFTASLALAFNAERKDRLTFIKSMSGIPWSDYYDKVIQVHNRLSNDFNLAKQLSKGVKKSSYSDREYDAIWSGNFSTSTAKDYTDLISRINSGKFSESVQPMLQFLFEEWTMADNPELSEQFEGIAYKGAGTPSIVNVWLYLRNHDHSTTQVTVMFKNLSSEQREKVEQQISNFAYQLCTDKNYRDELMEGI